MRGAVARVCAALLALLVVAAGTDGAAAAGHRSPAPGGAPAGRHAYLGPSTLTRTITVSWQGDGTRRYTRAAPVPGIGTVTLVCKPNNTIVRLTADSRRPETQMWMAKYEVKSSTNVVAVKNARIYTYANANDDGTGGTGPAAHEGLNQQSPVENYAKGYAHGIISQRPGRNRPAGAADLPPATSFELTWYWNGFHQPAAYQSCKVSMTLVTHLDQGLGIAWHGDADAAGHDLRTASIPDLGDLALRCETTRQGEQTVTLTPATPDPDASVYVEEITGEGAVDDHVDAYTLDVDPLTGVVGPVDLPRNGMLRLYYTVDGVQWPYIVSSYQVTNNQTHPELNLCEVAVAAF
ncbi:MAG: hypothetical protein ACXVWZ_06825 [Nocardioides sp.]